MPIFRVPFPTLLGAFLGLCCLSMATTARAERVALVMGNGTYLHAEPLRNATNDARDMARHLRTLGFEVYEGIDLPRQEAERLIQTFSQRLRPTDTALFYYAGHATQIGARNYLMPVDARSGDPAALIRSSIHLQSVLGTMEHSARVRLVILDACRNNPFLKDGKATRSSGSTRGLFRMEADVGSFIAYSTAPGSVAADGTGRNSPFTAALLRHMSRPGDNIHAVMRRVRAEVMTASNGRQIPWENSALIEEVFLAAPAPAPSASTADNTATAHIAGLLSRQPGFQATHRVFRLDPQGDGFLALRSGPGSQYPRLTMLTEGTPLHGITQNGAWMQVQTPEGLQGWAHANWIRAAADQGFGTGAKTGAGAGPQRTASPANGNSCDALWYQRNAIFAAKGYCFKSARGQASFSNASCVPGMSAGQTPLSQAERSLVADIQRRERAMNCP